jgi:hypothetical protein
MSGPSSYYGSASTPGHVASYSSSRRAFCVMCVDHIGLSFFMITNSRREMRHQAGCNNSPYGRYYLVKHMSFSPQTLKRGHVIGIQRIIKLYRIHSEST